MTFIGVIYMVQFYFFKAIAEINTIASYPEFTG